VYPTYDYTHAIVDSLENVTYSMCTLEFEVRRESYFWLLHELDLYKPKVWEYSRLNISNNVLSKRRLRSLVTDGHVRGWDDPRLLTINGLRRRGVPPAAINRFIQSIGVSRNLSTMIPMDRLLLCVREELNPTATRAMGVLCPLKVTLTNWDAARVEERVCQDLPGEEHRERTHVSPLTRVVYIEQEDFMMEPTKDFIRLAPGRTAHLKNAYNITVTEAVTAADGSVTELLATVDFESKAKPQAKLHWVAEPQPGQRPLEAEVRVYEKLFLSEDPMPLKDWVSDLNPQSLTVHTAFVDPFVLKDAAVGKHYQFERVGYFVVDPDSCLEQGKLVFNRVCPLREGKPIKK
jgi:glutaminyl-tRNA synthetase